MNNTIILDEFLSLAGDAPNFLELQQQALDSMASAIVDTVVRSIVDKVCDDLEIPQQHRPIVMHDIVQD